MIKHLISLALLIFMISGVILHDAEAKRFGGGRSFGASRSISSFSRPSPAFSQMANKPTSGLGNRWMGPLAGLVAGGLLASLFMQNGAMSGLMTWVLVGGILLLLVKFLQTKKQPQPQPFYRQQESSHSFTQAAAAPFMQQATQSSRPVGFDEAAFLRDAKVQFIRLQAAYDKKDLQDIRDFTLPEVFAEIQLQLHERGTANNVTHVVSVEAELLNVEDEVQPVAGTNMQSLFASVRFTGLIQEEANLPATQFNEIWHFAKELGTSRWLVAGVQQ